MVTKRKIHASCECSDPGCRVEHGDRICGKRSTGKVYRADMEDHTGIAMCVECTQDAFDSGVFGVHHNKWYWASLEK